ncbi:MAG: adenosine deaminase [Bryobacteraceae bacterium]|nr:adenosine deaminase [Bryobacteraceae bacterium]
MREFCTQLRKAELHVHLEGSVEPETLREMHPEIAVEEIRRRYHHTDFAGFIQSYVWVNRLLQTPEHYGLITRRLLERLAAENVGYAEINLSVGVILWKEQDFYGIFRAVSEAAAMSPVDVYWNFDAVRQFGAEPAQKVAELAVELQDENVVAFGIGGDEIAGPAGWFQHVFAWTLDKGLAIVPHAGESEGPDSVWACINMGARRIGHGFRAAEDPELVDLLCERQIALEICLTSNVKTGSIPSLAEHPVRKLFDAGVPITLNTDDPALFETTLSREFEIAAETFGFTKDELQIVAENAFRHRLGA